MNKNFLIYRSSAGSGKTFTLVKEYLKLSLPKSEFKNILAITFTNKAANEMKTRILKELSMMKNIATVQKSGMVNVLCGEMGYSIETLREKAAALQTKILHKYSDFSVYTIDSFTQKIIQTFAYDLGIPLNYKVLLQKDDIVQKSVDELLNLVGTEGEEELTKIITSYVDEQMEGGDTWNVEGKLIDVSEEIFKETAPEYLGKIKDLTLDQFGKIYLLYKTKIKDYETNLQRIGKQILDVIKNEELGEVDFYQGSRGVYGFLEKISKGNIVECNSYVRAFVDDEGKRIGSKTENSERVEAILPDMLKAVAEIVDELNGENYERYCTRKEIIKKIYSMALLNTISDKIKAYQDSDEVLHISEFNKRISEVVLNQPVPFLYERLGERYKHFLIDEFQDTSVMQWQNILPLITNSLAMGEFSMVVGDGKQAIYRFRQGEVEQFVKLPDVYNPHNNEYIRERGEELKRYGDVKNLMNNHRTGKVIVDFNNDFFKYIAKNILTDNEKIADIYLGEDYRKASAENADNKVKPLLHQEGKNEGGYVSVKLIEAGDDGEVKTNVYEEIYANIVDLVENKGYKYKDIAILARKNDELNKISTYLSEKENTVPVVSSESFLLGNNREILFLRSILGLLVDFSDKALQLKVLDYLSSRGMISETYIRHFENGGEGESLFKLLRTNGFDIDENELLSKTIYDCCESVVRIFSLANNSPGYIASFLNVAAAYSTDNKQDMAEFLEYFISKTGSLSIKTSSEVDAVNLITVHKSKGLEYPIVIYPVLPSAAKKSGKMWVEVDENVQNEYLLPVVLISDGEKIEKTSMRQSYQDEQKAKQMDDINVLYVALTRPKEKLFVYLGKRVSKTSNDKNDKKLKTIDYFERYLLDTGLVELNMSCKQNATVYECGVNEKATDKEDENKKDYCEIDTIISNDWSGNISISPEKNIATQIGILLHDILSHIYTYNDVDHVLECYRVKMNLPDDKSKILRNRVENIVFGDETSKYFDPRYAVKTECEILYKNDMERDKIYRPDRIVFTPDETWVVDFKTGVANKENQEQEDKYQEQIDRYVKIISEMGYPKVSGKILYF